MKTSVTQAPLPLPAPAPFRAVTVTLLLESQAELDVLAALCCYTVIEESVREVGGPPLFPDLFRALTASGAVHGNIFNQLTGAIENHPALSRRR